GVSHRELTHNSTHCWILWLTNAVPGWLRDFVAIRNAFSRNAVKNGLVLIVSGLLLYDVRTQSKLIQRSTSHRSPQRPSRARPKWKDTVLIQPDIYRANDSC